MQYRELGSSGIKTSVIALGTFAMGGWKWGSTDEKDAISAIHAAADVGINFIDTAPVYGQGLAEDFVGRAIKGKREKLVIATKCGLIWHIDQGTRFSAANDGTPIYKYQGAESIRYEVEQSLRRLRTDYIDLYQTHWQDTTTPIEETMNELLKLKEEGKIRAIGVSNANLAQLEEYSCYGVVDSDQEMYSMLDRKMEQEQLPWCIKHNAAFLAYGPMARGLLTGKMGPERQFSSDDQRITNPRYSVENRKRVADMHAKIAPLTEKYGANGGQLVIAWTLAQPGVTHVLCGARNAAQAIENAGGTVELTQTDIALINDAANETLAGI